MLPAGTPRPGTESSTNISSRGRKIVRDVLWTSVTSLALLGLNLVLNYLLARRGATSLFEPFNLAKRVGASAVPILTMGLTIGMVRAVAEADSDEAKAAAEKASIAIVVASCIIGTGVLIAAHDHASVMLLGQQDNRLLWAIWAYSLAMTMNILVYSVHRARLRQSTANWSSLVSLSIAPVVIVAAMPKGWDASLLLFAVAGIAISLNAAQLAVIWSAHQKGIAAARIVSAGKCLIQFSLPRVLAGVAGSWIYLIGPWAAHRSSGFVVGSQILAALAFGQAGSASLQALSMVLLPHAAELHASGNRQAVGRLSVAVLQLVWILGATFVPFLVVAARPLTTLWLGPSFASAAPAVAIVTLSVPAMIIHNAMTSVTDGVMHWPVSAWAACLGLGVTLSLTLGLGVRSASSLALAFALGQWSAALLVVISLAGEVPIRLPARWMAGSALMGAVALALSRLILGASPTGSSTTLARVVVAALPAAVAAGLAAATMPGSPLMRRPSAYSRLP